MGVGESSGRGVLPLMKVPKNVIINSEKCLADVLVPLLEHHVSLLYPGEINNVFVHHGSASSHTLKKTAEFSADLESRLRITAIPKEDLPVKGAGTSLLNFYAFGALWQRLQHRVRMPRLDSGKF